MKIAFFSPAWPAANAQNGVATYVEVMTRALERAGCRCVVITPHVHGEAADNVIPLKFPKAAGPAALVERLRHALGDPDEIYRGKFIRAVAAALEEASRDGPLDLFEIEESFGWAHELKDAAPCPVFMRTHGPHFLGHFGAFTEKDKRRVAREGEALKTCLALSSPSPGLLAETTSHYGSLSSNAATIANPVEFPAPEARWRLDDCDRNMLLFVGRFDRRKGADIALEMFARLAPLYPDLRLVMAGKDNGLPDGEGGVLKFEAYAARFLDKAVRERVTFLGPRPQPELHALRRKAFLCVHSSRFETFHYALLEALVLGAPVVASATYGPCEFLKPGQDLLVADIEDAEGLAAHAASLLDAPARAAAMAEAGREAAYECFSPDLVAAQYLSFCRGVLESRAAPAGGGGGA